MKKKMIVTLFTLFLTATMLCGCTDKNAVKETETATESSENAEAVEEAEIAEDTEESESAEASETSEEGENTRAQAELPDGTYSAEFHTDSSMFHVNEACDGKGTLTVSNGEMTIHISLTSKNILNLYPGLSEDAKKDGAELLNPTEDTVTYSDGMTEEVYGFDVPVPALDEEFDLALIGTKGTWYDHKVSVSNPEPLEENAETKNAVTPEDGTYTIELTFEGGSGKAEIISPATVTVSEGVSTATVTWSSSNYDYMLVDGEKYLPVNTDGNSVFEIPILIYDEPMEVIGDTVAMSKPHEVEYTITFHSDTMKAVE